MDDVWRALADPTRRRILALLRKGDMSAGEIAEHFELSKATLSGHFTVLKHAGLIRGDKRGTSIVYQLNITLVEEALWHLMSTLDVRAKSQVQASRARGSRRSRSSP